MMGLFGVALGIGPRNPERYSGRRTGGTNHIDGVPTAHLPSRRSASATIQSRASSARARFAGRGARSLFPPMIAARRASSSRLTRGFVSFRRHPDQLHLLGARPAEHVTGPDASAELAEEIGDL